MIGQTILHYEITAKIGAGGMGEVYLATDTKLDRPVALKFLPEVLQRDPEARERLIREAKAASRLSHPNILTIHSVEQVEGRDFIVMEYLEGLTLDQYCHEKAPPLSGLLGIAVGLANGLAKAHGAGITHRDLKPSNIVLDADGRAKILDFGLAKREGASKLTRTGSTVGTTAYMSPEQAQGAEASTRSDLFSLGVILYEMITGHRPFTGDHDAAILYAIVHDTPEPLARYKSNVPDELQWIVTKCLCKRPEERYQSAADLTADLKRLKKVSESSVATPVSTVAASSSQARPAVRRSAIIAASSAVVIVLLLLIIQPWKAEVEPTEEAVTERKMLAVLPFANLGAEDQEYFADGITEAITSRLAGVHALGVISRTSAMTYKESDKGLKEIGRELGVDYILEGTIQWDRSGDTDRVLITPQLIRVDDDTHLWATRYERPMTQVFVLQAEIAEKVTRALDVALLERDRQSIAAVPTENLEAYDLYLRADYYLQRGYRIEDVDIAQKLLEQAISLDSNFATAYALMSMVQASQYWFGIVRPVERIESAKVNADRALRLDPDLPIGHLALGLYYYWGHLDYERALGEFGIAQNALPAQATEYSAAINRRQGDWGRALENYEIAVALNPRSATTAFEYALTLRITRRFNESEQWFQRATVLSPDFALAHIFRAGTFVAWRGDVERYREILTEASTSLSKGQLDFSLALYFEDKGDFVEARRLATMDAVLRTMPTDSSSYYLFHARLYGYEGQTSLMTIYADSAREIAERWVASKPEGPPHHAILGEAHAILGRKDEAIREGRRGVELLPLSKDALEGPYYIETLAQIYADVGEHELAIDLLEQLLSIPSWTTVHTLRLDRRWNSLRDNPRFQALLEQEDKVF
jgi:TolB-like protein/predicted Ser/Thr protein kinase